MIERVYEEDFQRKLFELIGIRNRLDDTSKNNLFIKYSLINQRKNNTINYFQSPHPHDLQMSQYIKIENDVEHINK